MTDEGVTTPPPASAQKPAGTRAKAALVLAAMFLLGGAAGVAVGRMSAIRDLHHMMEGPPSEVRVNLRLAAMRRHLSLRPDQVDRIRAVMVDSESEREKLLGTCAPGLDDLHKRTEGRVREILDDEQRTHFDELVATHHGRTGSWMGHPPASGTPR